MKVLNILACTSNLGTIVKFIKSVLTLIQIVVPIILIIVGAFDLAKAVMGSDEKEIKAATQKLIKRAIAAVGVFFLSTAVQVIMHYVATSADEDEDAESWADCWLADSTVTETEEGGTIGPPDSDK